MGKGSGNVPDFLWTVFCNGDASNDVVSNEYCYIDEKVQKIDDWNCPPRAMDVRDFYGGDLQGVMDKLDYLQDLGVDVLFILTLFLYLLPIINMTFRIMIILIPIMEKS